MKTKSRAIWADAVKGFCIVLIVLGHAVAIVPTMSGAVGDVMQAAVLALVPLRVPLFFLISGYFASRAIERSWRAVARPRIFGNIYLYALWLLVATAVYTWVVPFPLEAPRYEFNTYPREFWYPVNHLWYLYALTVYFVIARLLNHLPTWAWLGSAVILNVLSGPLGSVVPANFGRNLLYYLIGALAPVVVERVVKESTWLRFWVVAGVYVALAALVRFADMGEFPGATLPLSLLAIAAGIQGFVLASNASPAFVSPFAWIGLRTLPIYVMHVPLLVGVASLMPHAANSLLLYCAVGLGVAIVVPVIIKSLVARVSFGRCLFESPTLSCTHTFQNRQL